MKKYMLTAIIDGRTKIYNKEFSTRNAAIDYIFNHYHKHILQNIHVEEEYIVDNDKHNIEYVCDYDNRFKISRQIA